MHKIHELLHEKTFPEAVVSAQYCENVEPEDQRDLNLHLFVSSHSKPLASLGWIIRPISWTGDDLVGNLFHFRHPLQCCQRVAFQLSFVDTIGHLVSHRNQCESYEE